MARLARLFIPGCPQHVIHRGHNRMVVFLDDEDRQRYMGWLLEALREHDIALHAWVLMGNHLHMLWTAPSAAAGSGAMASVARRYAQHYNRRYARSGTIWEGRYRSTVVTSPDYVLACYRYIDLNPVRAGLVEHPAAWPWSSYLHHTGQRVDDFIADHPLYWDLGNTPFERQAAYARFCQHERASEVETITRDTLRGWALGGPAPEGAPPSRRAAPLPRGRPRKTPGPSEEGRHG